MGRYTDLLVTLSEDRRGRLARALRGLHDTSARRLVAYVVPRRGMTLDPAALRAHCGRELPEYMVPSAFVRIDTLPIGPSGKVDRRALPAPAAASARRAPSAAPRGPLEETLAAIWCRVLALPAVGRDDDFFADLGGHSLLAARLLVAIREELPVDLQLRALFEQPTLARLAAAIDSGSVGAKPGGQPEPAITRRSRDAHRGTEDLGEPSA
jgi:hypothetical protein